MKDITKDKMYVVRKSSIEASEPVEVKGKPIIPQEND